ncbi:transposase [Halobaculum sp. MBLA0147]|uniref:transposase n=1 Tax=Halobaculum sp. MBLA0147 TaxID=3079934 RepID=UPI003524F18E
MSSSDVLTDPVSPAGRQAKETIEQGTTWDELADRLNPEPYRSLDEYSLSHASRPFDQMFLATLWAKTEDDSLTGIPTRLEESPDIARAFGFSLDDLPSGDTFTYTWRNRFSEIQERIEIAADEIDAIATANGSPIGAGGIDPVDSSGSSKQTKRRFTRKYTREMLGQVQELIFPELELPRPDGAIYDENDLLQLETVAGMEQDAVNDAGKQLGDILDVARDIDPEEDPFYRDGPTGETLLNVVHQLTVDEFTEMVNRAVKKMVTRIKPYAEFSEPVHVAIDVTYVAYWGERDELKRLSGAPDDKKYDWCHKFATVSLIDDNTPLVVGLMPLGDPDSYERYYPGQDNESHRYGEVVRQLISMAEDHVRVRSVYADRAFASADVIQTLENQGVKYIIPVPKNSRIKRWLDRNVSGGIVAVEDEWGVYGPVKYNDGSTRVETSIVGMPADPDEDQYGFGVRSTDDSGISDGDDSSPTAFYTNKHVDDTTAVDRRSTIRTISRYTLRGAIEMSYRKIKEFLSYTTSKDFCVRWWHFGFGVLLYNVWLTVDFLVQQSLDCEILDEPRVSASRFRGFLNRQLTRLI